MRTRLGSAPSAWLFAAFSGFVGVGCASEPSPQLREWRASDHQPPPAVAPEGQGAGEDAPPSAARAAQALWGMRCASCHGEGGRGDGAGRPPGAAIPDMTAAAFQSARDDKQLAETIFKGKGLMPAFGDQLTEQGIVALIGHIRTLKATP